MIRIVAIVNSVVKYKWSGTIKFIRRKEAVLTDAFVEMARANS